MWRTLVLIAVAVGCRESRPVGIDAAPVPARADLRQPSIDASLPPAIDAGPAAPSRFDDAGDEAAALAAIAAMPAWSAVIERDRLLTRRHQRGAVFGLIGPQAGEATDWWLHDETEGQGRLAIRIRLPVSALVATGDRVVVWGAWQPQGAQWVFAADRVELRAVRGSAERVPPPPARLAIDTATESSADAVPVSQRRQAGVIQFVATARPARFGDGWLIADRRDLPPVARLFLPGERRPYGGQTPPLDDEWWPLELGVLYELEIARFRPPRQPGQLLVLQAVSPPIRISPPPPETPPETPAGER